MGGDSIVWLVIILSILSDGLAVYLYRKKKFPFWASAIIIALLVPVIVYSFVALGIDYLIEPLSKSMRYFKYQILGRLCMGISKDIINVVLVMKTFDTSKMDAWTDEQWQQFVGDGKDHEGIQLLLMDNSSFYLKIASIHFDEATEEMVFSIDAQNKMGKKIFIQFGQWHIDESIYNLTEERPLYLDGISGVRSFQKCVKRSYLDDWDKTLIEMKLLDAETNIIIRELEFQIVKQYTQIF